MGATTCAGREFQDKVGHNTNGDGMQGDTEQITQDKQANVGRHRGGIACWSRHRADVRRQR